MDSESWSETVRSHRIGSSRHSLVKRHPHAQFYHGPYHHSYRFLRKLRISFFLCSAALTSTGCVGPLFSLHWHCQLTLSSAMTVDEPNSDIKNDFFSSLGNAMTETRTQGCLCAIQPLCYAAPPPVPTAPLLACLTCLWPDASQMKNL